MSVAAPSAITASRHELRDALVAAGVRTSFRGQAFSPPCAIISADDPWVMPGYLGGGRSVRWRVWAVGAVADQEGADQDVENVMVAVIAACDALYGWSMVTFSAPLITDIAGSNYKAARGAIDTDIGGT
jgi:hypothetical protein